MRQFTQPYPASYELALQEESELQPEFPPESFGEPQEEGDGEEAVGHVGVDLRELVHSSGNPA